jgi:hypothetical protein
MNTERELNTAIQALRKLRDELLDKGAATVEINNLAAQIKGKMKELSDYLSNGAEPCPICGELPIGMQVKPGVYEVGPIGSQLRARGSSPEEAVEKWNAQDFYFKNDEEKKACLALLQTTD